MNADRYRAAERELWQHYGVTVSERWLDLKEPSTRVRIFEVGDGPPVLFVHGGPNAASTWAPLASRLTKVRCIVLDRPGCGLSPAIDYMQRPLDETMVCVLSSVIEALDLPRVDIVASSFGGACAFWLAGRQPDRVGRIVQLGCPAFVSQMKASPFLRLLATPGLGALAARLPMNRGAVDGMMKSMGHGETVTARRLPEPYFGWCTSLARDTETMVNERVLVCCGLTWRGMRPELVFRDETIQALSHPTYYYWGAADPFATVEYGRSLVQGMQAATIDVIPGSGHLPWWDDPQDAADRTAAFLAAH